MSFFFRDPDPRFVPTAKPEGTAGEPLVFAVRRHDLVLRTDAPSPIPSLEEARAAGLASGELVAFGALDGRPCFVAPLPDDAPVPAGFDAGSIRRLVLTLDGPWLAAGVLAGQIAHFEATTRFCSRCAGALARKPAEHGKHCAACGRDVYPHVAPCVIVLVHDGDRIVLTRQKRFPPGMYGLVAGFVEMGESLETCVRREVLEETGLTVDDVRYEGSQPWPFPSQLMVGFYARWTGGEIRPDETELEEAKWFSLEALPGIPPPLSIARHLIDLYLERRGARAG